MRQLQDTRLKPRASIRKRLIIFGAVNLITWLLLPQLFWGVWDTVGGISSAVAEQRAYHHIKRSRGRTQAELWRAKNEWGGLFKSLGNFEFIK